MSKPKLSLSRVDDYEAWDALVCRSPQGTLFSELFYLQATARKHHLWFVKQGMEIKAGICLAVSDDEQHCELDDLLIYGGILFDLNPKRQLVKRRHDEFQIAEFVAEQLAERYMSIELVLCPQFQDMRPFQWYRYHDDNIHKYELRLRYTSYLDIASIRECIGNEENSQLFAGMETVRRYSIREGQKKGGKVVESSNCEVLMHYYKNLMERQGEVQTSTKLEAMNRIMNVLLQSGRGAVFHVFDANNIILYAVMYGWDSKRGYYLFGAGHPDISTPWQGTIVHWTAFKYLSQQHGITNVDMEGVNSPRRGWFKLGFGGDLRPYYHVRKTAAMELK